MKHSNVQRSSQRRRRSRFSSIFSSSSTNEKVYFLVIILVLDDEGQGGAQTLYMAFSQKIAQHGVALFYITQRKASLSIILWADRRRTGKFGIDEEPVLPRRIFSDSSDAPITRFSGSFFDSLPSPLPKDDRLVVVVGSSLLCKEYL